MSRINEQKAGTKERRQYNRTSVRFGPTVKHREDVGQLVNVSHLGLAFDYVQLEGARSIESEEDDYLFVTYLDQQLNEFTSDRIPCQVISDKVVGHYPEVKGFVIRRKRVAFRDLNKEVREKIVSTLLDFSKEKQMKENDAFCPCI